MRRIAWGGGGRGGGGRRGGGGGAGGPGARARGGGAAAPPPAGAAPDEGEATTDADGEATFTYANSEAGEDTVFACTDEDGEAPDACSADGESLVDGVIGDDAAKAWLGVDALTLEPQEATNEIDSEHTVTATVTDAEGNGVPAAEVRFEVWRDDTLADSADPFVETISTDEDGRAAFAYTNTDPGEDTVFACTEEDGSAPVACSEDGETLEPDVIGDAATKAWLGPAEVALTPQEATNAVGDEHAVTATVTDDAGNRVPQTEVRFEVWRDGAVVEDDGDTTDEDGQAHFDYEGGEPGEDTILVCVDPDDPSTEPDQCSDDGETLHAELIGDTAAKFWEQRADDVSVSPQFSSNPPGDEHTVTATVEDGAGNPIEGVRVRFDVFRDFGSTRAETGTAVTDAATEVGEVTTSFPQPRTSTGSRTPTLHGRRQRLRWRSRC
jgi:hypothetical protein